MLLLLPLAAGCERLGGPAPLSTMAGAQTAAPAAPQTVTVGRGDSVYLIAKRYSVPLRELIDLNQLQPPYRLEPGQSLRLPATRTYTVQRGDALSMLARQHQVETAELARLNNLPPPYNIRIGQVLILPPAAGTTAAAPAPAAPGWKPGAVTVTAAAGSDPLQAPPGVAPATIAPSHGGTLPAAAVSASQPLPPPGAAPGSAVAPAVIPLPPPTEEAVPAPGTKPAAALPPGVKPLALPSASATPAAPAQTAQAAPAAAKPPVAAPPPRAGTRFMWPVRGKVLSEFGDKPDGRHNDGLNIAAPRGTVVMAADNGVVAYAGNELRGYGNLLLIRHANGWMTAYAHLEQILVERGAQVRRGQRIGTVGSTGTVTAPQLHFEVRRDGQAVDPSDYMEAQRQTTQRPAGTDLPG